MFLKSIEIFGFKSFADRTCIDFMPGVTAVIGPNGCGKSNIVDAVKWVLGSQSAKQLRGCKMEDIIFNGTHDRKSLSMAEVSITFDNAEGKLPIDFHEVTVTRRLFRSGESEYLINSAACRLKDITELFLDTGLGVDAYSMMEQNKLDFIIYSKPEEKRAIFEEAAGIMKYKTKKEETLRKLEATKANLLRISDIVGEIQKQINSLDYQVRKARQYGKNKEKIKILEIKHLCQDYMVYEEEIKKNNKILEDVSGRIEAVNSQISQKEAESAGLQLEAGQKEAAISKLQGKIFFISSEISRLENRIQLRNERKAELNNQSAGLKDDMEKMKSRIAALDAMREEYEQAEKTLCLEIVKNENKLLKSRQEALAALAAELEALKNDIRSRTESYIDIKGELTQLAAQIEAIRAEERSMRARRERLCKEEESINGERKSVSAELSLLDEKLGKYLGDLKGLEERKNKLADFVSGTVENNGLKDRSPEVFNALIELSRLVAEYDELIKSTIGQIEKDRHKIKTEDERFEDKLRPVVEERIAAEKKIITGAQKQGELAGLMGEMEKRGEENKNLLAARETKSISIENEIKACQEEIVELRLSCTRSKEKKSRLTEDLNRIASDKSDLLDRIKYNEKAVEDIFCRLKEIDVDIEEAGAGIKSFHSEQNEVNLRLKVVQNEKETMNEKLREETNVISILRKTLSSIQADSEKDRIKDAQVRMSIDRIIEKLRDDHEMTGIEDSMKQFSKEELEAPQEVREEELGTIEKIKNQIESLGPVNLAAPEEYEKLDERYKFLKTQEEDLIRSSEDLKTVITRINAISRENFENTFNLVRNNFQRIFTELFEGGAADIVLVDNENMLESGIDIIAQPPGKKLQSISLLSGGEKALCAIALLFAVFLVKPSPFCLLDEIDAPLDDANLERFKNMLKKYILKSQFIIITHNKKTMEMADVLYGITMEEFGVSKVISVKFKERENDLKTVEAFANETS